MRSSGDFVSFLSDSEDDETITVSVTIVVNSEELGGLVERREDSVIMSVNSLSMMGFCSAIVSRQRVVTIGFCRLLALVMVVQ